MKGNFHVQCKVGENLEITSKSYLSLWYKIAKKKKLTGVKKVAYVAGYTAVNSINPLKYVKKASKSVKVVKKGTKLLKSTKKLKVSKLLLKKTKKLKKVNLKKKTSIKKDVKKKAVTTPKKRRTIKHPKRKKNSVTIYKQSKLSKNAKVTEFVISNKGQKIDVTRSKNHKRAENGSNPRIGDANSSIDIFSKTGIYEHRRWYDSEGKAIRNVDMTYHRNLKRHPEFPHEHIWTYDENGNFVNR